MRPALSSAFSPPPLSSAFKRNILKETLFPDYRALYRRTRKYKFWPRHPKSYFLSLSLTVMCLHLLKDIDIMEFVMLCSVLPNLTFQMWIPVKPHDEAAEQTSTYVTGNTETSATSCTIHPTNSHYA